MTESARSSTDVDLDTVAPATVMADNTALPPFDPLSWAQGFGTGLILGAFVVALAGIWALR